MSKYAQLTTKPEVLYWISHNLENYLKKNKENQSEIEHIIDYLNSDEAPTRLKSMSYDEAKRNTEKWNDRLIKRAGQIVESDEDVKVVRNYKDGFKFVRLIGKAAFEREGNLMRHCVASYYGKKGIKIYSLRDFNNKPHCTIEVKQDDKLNINQIKGKGNGSIHPKYIKYVLDFLRIAKMPIRDNQMQNLGYFNPDSVTKGFSLWLDNNFDGLKYITYNNTKYYYVHQKFKKGI